MAVNTTFTKMAELSWQSLKTEWKDRGPTVNMFSEFIQDLKINNSIEMNDVYLILVVIVLFTVHRYLFTEVFLKPFAKLCNLTSEGQRKFPESGCKLIYYSFFFAYEYYLVNFTYPEFRTDLSSQWRGWFIGMAVPKDIYYLYILEAGFYFHSIYATLYMDVWKKDSIAMLLHHILANSLILFSLAVRYHRIGLLVLYLHDIADVCLESTKIVKYFKDKKEVEGKSSLVPECLSAVGFLFFSTAWGWCRLCLYPQIVLFSSMYVARTALPYAHFYFLFNTMLWMLFGLNVYWFHFIVLLMVRIATGSSKGVEDVREFEEKKTMSNGKEKKINSVVKDLHGKNGSSSSVRYRSW